MTDFLNEYGRQWLQPFGLMIVQNTLFLVFIFAVLYWMRNTAAWVRHLVALAGLVKLVTPPFVPFRTSAALEYVELPAIAAGSIRPLAPTAAPPAGDTVSLTLAGLLFGAWCAVAVGVLAHALITTVGLRITLRGSETAADGDSRDWSRRTGIGVRITDRVPVPMTVGLLPRTIFVPPQWTAWSSPAKRAVLRHEMAHIRRHDGVVRALETAVRALYWFHPLVPLLSRRIGAYREQACDETAAAPDPSGRLAYSRILVEIAEHLVHRPRVRSSASTLLRRRNELLDRVDYLTKKEGTIMSTSKTRAALLTAAMAVSITSLSWYRGTATPPPPPPKEHQNVEVSLAADGQVTLDGKKATLEKLGQYMKEKYNDKDVVVRMVCDENVPMSTLFDLHAVLRKAGLLKVSYAGLDGVAMPLVLPSEEMIEKAKKIHEERAELIARLEVSGDGQCTLDGKKLEHSMIRGEIEKRLAGNDSLIVSLEMTGDATFGQYVQTLKELKAAKANRIFVNEPGAL